MNADQFDLLSCHPAHRNDPVSDHMLGLWGHGTTPSGLWERCAAAQRLADAGTTQSAPEPSRAATEAPSDDERREDRYADIIIDGQQDYEHPHARARRVMAVADAEQAELRVEVESLRNLLTYSEGRTSQHRAEAAEAKVARVEALADEWATVGKHDKAAKRAHDKLRRALDGDA